MHKVYFIVGICLLLPQSVIIFLLVVKNSRQKSLEVQSRELNRHLIKIQEDERKNIARELHDDFGQRLAFLKVDLEMALQEAPPLNQGTATTRLRRILAGIEELAVDVQQLSHSLHSSRLQYLGLRSALKNLCAQVERQHHIAIDLQLGGPDENVSSDVELCFYRIAQEALHNITKHSGADRAAIKLSNDGSILRMEVSDNGKGFDHAGSSQGLGLASMRERVSMVGGDLQIRSTSGRGTVLSIQAPIARPAKHNTLNN